MPSDGPTSTSTTHHHEFPLHHGSVPLELVNPHDYTTHIPKCVLRVDDESYDLTQWRHKHPGGVQLLDWFHGKDATDAFYALHSDDAVKQLKRMPKKPVTDSEIPRDAISHDFEQWRRELVAQGFFKRPWLREVVRYIIPTFSLLIVGWCISASHPILAMFMMGLGMQQAGWLGHDWSHGRDTVPMTIGRFVAALSNGFSNSWWSNKHNTHHVFPNRLGIDSDVHNEPAVHLWIPSKKEDHWYRKYQHVYFMFAYAMLYVSWKMQSIQFVLKKRDWSERIPIMIHYVLLIQCPWYVAIGSVLLGGWFVALVVTVNHQPEPMMEQDSKYNFILDQFVTTRSVACPDPFTEFFFGGMQYQLEHHLWPTMPRAHFQEMRPKLLEWCKKHKLEHKLSGIQEIMELNYDIIKQVAMTESS